MKIIIGFLLLTATAVNATKCDVNELSAISNTSDAKECKQVSNFVVPVDTTENTILADLEAFCSNQACKRILEALQEVNTCSIDGLDLHQTVVNPIDAVCSTTRSLRATHGSHVHSSGMDMGSMEDSHDVASAEDSHDTHSATSGAEDSHDTTSSTHESTTAGDDDDDHDSHDTSSKSSTAGTAGSAATSNSTESTQAPNASSASSITVAAGSVFLAAAAAAFL
ncbi:hypothetical protein P3T76_008080 [Phytophthora citrophthora]|uniref:Elicitin n=1 Tax=Phytophthora citrophthora TaxID=4793 RepID=A0AAD9LMV5_9STRA|nr:hypothetical protein P3T76_008080 [Phytophthora citrophthora]